MCVVVCVCVCPCQPACLCVCCDDLSAFETAVHNIHNFLFGKCRPHSDFNSWLPKIEFLKNQLFLLINKISLTTENDQNMHKLMIFKENIHFVCLL